MSKNGERTNLDESAVSELFIRMRLCNSYCHECDVLMCRNRVMVGYPPYSVYDRREYKDQGSIKG